MLITIFSSLDTFYNIGFGVSYDHIKLAKLKKTQDPNINYYDKFEQLIYDSQPFEL